MKVLIGILLGLSPILFIWAIAWKGKKYGDYLVSKNLMDPQDVIEHGYLGCFFMWLFGADW